MFAVIARRHKAAVVTVNWSDFGLSAITVMSKSSKPRTISSG